MNILKEVEDRISKRNNIILNGLKDVNNTQEDFKFISNILATKGIIVDISKFSRLGIFDEKSDKPRPLLVKLNDVNQVNQVLKEKKNLFKNLIVKNDKTKKQRELYKKAAQELAERKNNGEENLFIKDINGIPTVSIFRKSNKNSTTNCDESGKNDTANDDNNMGKPANNAKSNNFPKINKQNTNNKITQKRKANSSDSLTDNVDKIIQDSDSEILPDENTPTNTPSKKPKN